MSANGSTAIDGTARCDAVTMVRDPPAGCRVAPVPSACGELARRSRSARPGVRASARSSARSTSSGTSARSARTGRTASVNRFTMIACAVGPVNGGSPASISYSTQPNE